MDPRMKAFFDKCNNSVPPYWIFADEDFVKSLTPNQALEVQDKIATLLGGQVKLVLTDCTFKNLTGSTEGFSFPATNIGCVCDGPSPGATCLKRYIGSEKFVGDVCQFSFKVFVATGKVDLYTELAQVFPIIHHSHGSLDLSLPPSENRPAAAENWVAAVENWAAAAGKWAEAAEKWVAAAENCPAAAEKCQAAAEKWAAFSEKWAAAAEKGPGRGKGPAV